MNITDTSITRPGYEWSLIKLNKIVLTRPSYDQLLNDAFDQGMNLSSEKFSVVEHLKDPNFFSQKHYSNP